MSSSPSPDQIFFDLSDRAKLRVRGADRLRYLQGQLTNDVRRATQTETLYAGVLTAKGRLCADVYLRAVAADGVKDGGSFLLDADPTLRETLVARLERYLIADDVAIEDVTDNFALIHGFDGSGEEGFETIAAATTPDETLPSSATLVRARANRFGRPGWDVFCAADTLGTLKDALRRAGWREGLAGEAETRRIAAGVPRWGAELDGDTLPPEAGLEATAISYDKGCYVGQETISRLKSLGHVNRHLRRLRTLSSAAATTAGGPTLAAGMRLHELPPPPHAADAVAAPGREVGRVTSVASVAPWDAAGGIALGYVRRGLEAPGTRLLAVQDPTTERPASLPPAEIEVEVVGSTYAPPPA